MNKEEIIEMIEQIGYEEFYRYYQEKDKYIELLKSVIDEVGEISLKMKHCQLLLGGKQKTNVDRILEILSKAKGE